LAQRQLAPGGLVQEAVELVAGGGQLQPREHVEEFVVVDNHQTPQPVARTPQVA
jgi:hypothetical protein